MLENMLKCSRLKYSILLFISKGINLIPTSKCSDAIWLVSMAIFQENRRPYLFVDDMLMRVGIPVKVQRKWPETAYLLLISSGLCVCRLERGGGCGDYRSDDKGCCVNISEDPRESLES